MPQNKNVLLRYKNLDGSFSSGRTDNTIDRLHDKIEDALGYRISDRQLREDMRNMREIYYAPIDKKTYEGHKAYYCYSDPKFSIYRTDLSDDEFVALRSTIEMLGKYRSGNPWLEEVLACLECRFDVVPDKEKIVHFDENTGLAGIECLGELIEHALNHEAIELTYCKFHGEVHRYVFSIHCVKQYNGRWYLCGQSSLKDPGVRGHRYSIFPVDRILTFKKSNKMFVENTTIDYSEHFKDVVGVTVPDAKVPLQTFRFRFSSDRLPYVLSKPMHHSQRVVDEANGIIEITVKHNKELDQLAFSYLPDIEVLEPVEYRNEIAAAIRKNLEKYGG